MPKKVTKIKSRIRRVKKKLTKEQIEALEQEAKNQSQNKKQQNVSSEDPNPHAANSGSNDEETTQHTFTAAEEKSHLLELSEAWKIEMAQRQDEYNALQQTINEMSFSEKFKDERRRFQYENLVKSYKEHDNAQEYIRHRLKEIETNESEQVSSPSLLSDQPERGLSNNSLGSAESLDASQTAASSNSLVNTNNFPKESSSHALNEGLEDSYNLETKTESSSFSNIDEDLVGDNCQSSMNTSETFEQNPTLFEFLDDIGTKILEFAEQSNIKAFWLDETHAGLSNEDNSEFDYSPVFVALISLILLLLLLFYARRLYLHYKASVEKQLKSIKNNETDDKKSGLLPDYNDPLSQRLESIMELF